MTKNDERTAVNRTMDDIQYLPTDGGFTLLVRPPGWASQRVFLVVSVIAFGLAALFTNAVFHSFKINGRPGYAF